MTRSKRVLFAAIFVLALVAALVLWIIFGGPRAAPEGIAVKIQLRDTKSAARLVELPDGSHAYLITRNDGTAETLSPEVYAKRLYTEQTSRPFIQRMFNITSPAGVAWVVIGFLGQLIFAGRMLVQWIISERRKESVVPPIFWWMSLVGATMLLAYFLWRWDIVGIFGQLLGWIIYIRNIWLIQKKSRVVHVTEDPAPEPELNEPIEEPTMIDSSDRVSPAQDLVEIDSAVQSTDRHPEPDER